MAYVKSAARRGLQTREKTVTDADAFCRKILTVPKKPNPAPQPRKVGDKIKVNMHAGKLVDATVKAIIDSTDGVKYQVDFGFDQTALVHEWQIVKD